MAKQVNNQKLVSLKKHNDIAIAINKSPLTSHLLGLAMISANPEKAITKSEVLQLEITFEFEQQELFETLLVEYFQIYLPEEQITLWGPGYTIRFLTTLADKSKYIKEFAPVFSSFTINPAFGMKMSQVGKRFFESDKFMPREYEEIWDSAKEFKDVIPEDVVREGSLPKMPGTNF